MSTRLVFMARCRGKIIVTGIGKSGLIAQKIAATLSSTGTPALYLHPAEGMHGDLGSVEKRDLIVAIGKSGESHELNALLPSLKRIGSKIIAITANPRSPLGKAPRSSSTPPSAPKPAPSTSLRLPAPPWRWPWATPWPSPSWNASASARNISPCFIPAANSGAV